MDSAKSNIVLVPLVSLYIYMSASDPGEQRACDVQCFLAHSDSCVTHKHSSQTLAVLCSLGKQTGFLFYYVLKNDK